MPVPSVPVLKLARKPISGEILVQDRPGDPRLGSWIQQIEALPKKSKRPGIVLYGCPDDLGVTLNRGRTGAAAGPKSIRKQLYKMSLPMDKHFEFDLNDLGNIDVTPHIEQNHSHAKDFAKAISKSGYSIIALGGGHDYAAPNFAGFCEGQPNKSTGLINVDPHLDVRPLEDGRPNSGTPFRMLLEQKMLAGKNFVEFGARAARNSSDNFSFCKKHRVKIDTFESIRTKKTEVVQQYKAHLLALSKKCDLLGATFDMDACSEADGTSAAPVLGFSAWEMCQMASMAGSLKKVRFLEIAEVAPNLDPTERSSRIAAEMIYSFLYARKA